jgi:hypothetical protein
MFKITHQELEQIRKIAKSISKTSIFAKKKSDKIIKLIDDKFLNTK